MTWPVFQSLLVDHIWILLLLKKIFWEGPVLKLLHLIVDHLFGCLSCFSRSRIQHIIYRLKSRSLRSSFGWSTMKKFSEVTELGIGPFQNVQREVIYFLFVVRKNVSELFKHFSIHCKSRGISGPYNFLTRIKSNTPDVWNWNCWALFGLEN